MRDIDSEGTPTVPTGPNARLPATGRRLLGASRLGSLEHTPEIPPRMERNIRAATGIPDTEPVHAFLDCTVFNSGKDGLAFSDIGLWYHHANNRGRGDLEAAPTFLSWAELARHRCEPLDDAGTGVRIGPWRYEFGGSAVDAGALCQLLDALSGAVHEGHAVVGAEPSSMAPGAPDTEGPSTEGPSTGVRADRSSIDTGVAAVLGVPLAIVAALVAMATIWLASPWGPRTAESATVIAIDVEIVAGGPRMGGHWFVYSRTEAGDEFRMNTPTGSAAAQVGQTIVVERSAWTGRPLALVIDDRRHGAGQDLGAVFRAGGLVLCAGVVALLCLALLQIGRQSATGLAVVLALMAIGVWLGSSLLLV